MGAKARVDLMHLPTKYIHELSSKFDSISPIRREELEKCASLIKEELNRDQQVHIVAVCTHNSRRSQLFELWLMVACHYYHLGGIHSHSAGTEKTAFNSRMITALQAKGFDLNTENLNDINPVYLFDNKSSDHQFFSKTIGDIHLDKFIAIMVCDHADDNCPYIPAASYRLSLNYVDPKYADDSPSEAMVYKDKVDEIGVEVLYLVSLLVDQNKRG